MDTWKEREYITSSGNPVLILYLDDSVNAWILHDRKNAIIDTRLLCPNTNTQPQRKSMKLHALPEAFRELITVVANEKHISESAAEWDYHIVIPSCKSAPGLL